MLLDIGTKKTKIKNTVARFNVQDELNYLPIYKVILQLFINLI